GGRSAAARGRPDATELVAAEWSLRRHVRRSLPARDRPARCTAIQTQRRARRRASAPPAADAGGENSSATETIHRDIEPALTVEDHGRPEAFDPRLDRIELVIEIEEHHRCLHEGNGIRFAQQERTRCVIELATRSEDRGIELRI